MDMAYFLLSFHLEIHLSLLLYFLSFLPLDFTLSFFFFFLPNVKVAVLWYDDMWFNCYHVSDVSASSIDRTDE